MTSRTHNRLVDVAAAWLRDRYPVVVTEIASSAGETPDALGIGCGFSHLIECKASRADFLADQRKPWRQHEEGRHGRYPADNDAAKTQETQSRRIASPLATT